MSQLIKFINIGSGSKGNASFLIYKDTFIQIDMGLPLRRITGILDKLNKSINDINGLLITHNHNDHIKGIKYFHNQVKIFCSEGTLNDDIPHTIIKSGSQLNINDIKINVLKTSHDAPNPIGFLFEFSDKKFCYITDTGIIPAITMKKIKNCDYYVFESNHDLDMLEDSDRSTLLKKRIKGSKGHLNNYQSADYLCSLIGDKTKAILLAHLSEECNTPEVALNALKQRLEENGIDFKNILIDVLKQNEETWYED